jgi:hypothetical protein
MSVFKNIFVGDLNIMRSYAYFKLLSRALVLPLIFVITSCGGNETSDNGGTNTCEPSEGGESDLYGNWIISSIESVAPNAPMDSEFTFSTNGTYDWFFMIDTQLWKANTKANGSFSLNGTTLLIDGNFTDIVAGNSVEISFCNNNRNFNFLDENGYKWTYSKVDVPGGCNTHDCIGPHKHVFTTSIMYTGNLIVEAGSSGSGIEAADELCQNAAVNAGRNGTWKAWISDNNNNAIDRIADVGPWYLVGTSEYIVFENKAGMTQNPLRPIDHDEFGDVISFDPQIIGNEVWTGTNSDGTNSGLNCSNWAFGDTLDGKAGDYELNDVRWTNTTTPRGCEWQNHLYCFEQ